MKQLLQLIDVKSLVTLAMTGAMIALLFAPVDPNPEAGQARLIAIAADAAGAVAAHLAHGAVAVEEQHAEVPLALGLVHDHEAVGPQGAVGGAEGLGDAGEGFGGQALLQVVEDDEVVAGSVHFPEFHGVVSLSAGRRGLRPLQIKIKRSVVPAS